MKPVIPIIVLSGTVLLGQAQGKKGLTPEAYAKAKGFTVKDLDNDTYVKFENAFILDRYESRKPYFITGDDGQKKRIDIYKLIAKEGMADLGVMIFYTNEKGTVYKAVMPNFTADGKVWEQYFEDIHAIDKQEPNFVLKLSYVLSKEFGFQLYKSANAGKDISGESGTYGTDICFPGTMQVSLAGGGMKALQDVVAGDQVITVDPVTQASSVVTVKELTKHAPANYALTKLTLLRAQETVSASGTTVLLNAQTVQATPNHPVMTVAGEKAIGAVETGDQLLCLNKGTGQYETFTVWQKTEAAGGVQPVYNIVADGGRTFMMNGVMVLQK